MSIFFKFKSAKDFNSFPMESQFISVGNLKERIFGLKYYGRGNDTDLVFSNAQTNQEYTDQAALIPRNTSVLIRRVPGRPRMHIVKPIEDSTQNLTPDTSNVAAQHSTMHINSYSQPEESEWDEFGNDPYAIVPEGLPAQSFNPASVSSSDMIDEDSKLRAFLETPSLNWSSQKDQPRGRGYGRGIGGRMMGGRGFGRGLFENRNPPPGYVCHRCNNIGHFIHHCPTNGDPAYDLKRFKPPTGRAVAVLQPNEAAFQKAIEGIPTLARAVVKECSFGGANGVEAPVAIDTTPESATNKDPRSPERSPLMKDNAEKPPIGHGKKKQRPAVNPCFGSATPHMEMDPSFGTAPYGGAMPPYTGLPPASYGGGLQPVPDPFMAQNYLNMTPSAPRDLVELGNVGMNMGQPPMMHQGEDFKGRRVITKHKRYPHRENDSPPHQSPRFKRQKLC